MKNRDLYDINIYAEINNIFQPIITVSEKYFLVLSSQTTFPFKFVVGFKNKEDGEKTITYYIKKVSPTAECEIMLDPNNPVELIVK